MRTDYIYGGYANGIRNWQRKNDKFYTKPSWLIYSGVKNLDEALIVYAYSIKCLKQKPQGLMLNCQGALLQRKLKMSKTQLYWKIMKIIFRGSLYWGTVLSIGTLMGMTSPLENLLVAYFLNFNGEGIIDLFMKHNHNEAVKHKVKTPYLHLEEVIFTNALLLGMDGDYWIDHAGYENDRLHLNEDLKIIKEKFYKRQK